MRDPKERPKASDIFRDKQPLFGEKVTFDRAFPEIKDVTIVIEESGHGFYEAARTSTYTLKNFPGEYIDCSNSVCHNGGVSVGRILRDMVRNKETVVDTIEFCQGNEASPKGRRVYRKCVNRFKIKVTVTYKESKEPQD